MSFNGGLLLPGTAIVTTAETVAKAIGPLDLAPPPLCVGLVIRGALVITTGASATSIVPRCRVGGVTGPALGGTAGEILAGASASFTVPFHFVDANLANIGVFGYSVTVVQNGASGNGAVVSVSYELDWIVP